MAHFTAPDAATLDRVAYLVGYPIAHSLSPLLHYTMYSNLGQNWAQRLYETQDLDDFVRHMKSNPKFFGASVTMPYKVDIIPHLDEMTLEGQAIGAINTVFLKADATGNRRYCGTNTDCIGIREAFLQNIPDASRFRGKPALIVGGGGTSRAAVYSLQHFLGCSPIYMINRDKNEVEAVMSQCISAGYGEHIIHVSSVSQAQGLPPPCAIVSAVPDFAPVTAEEIAVREILGTFLSSKQKGALLEMCYHPSPNTQIDVLARGLGWQVILGTEAMIGQGMEQARLWTGIEIKDLPRDAARNAVRTAISKDHVI